MLIGSRSNTSKSTNIDLSGGLLTTTNDSVTTPIISNLLGKSMFEWSLFVTTSGTINPNIIVIEIRAFPEAATDSSIEYKTPANTQYEFAEGSLLIIYNKFNTGVVISSYLDRSGVLTPLPVISPSFQLVMKVNGSGQNISAATGNLFLTGA